MHIPSRLVLAGFIILFIVTIGKSETSSRWSPEKYKKYTYRSFADYNRAQQRLNIEKIDNALLHAAIFYETNRRRAQNDLPQFTHSSALEEAAFAHSRDMVANNFFSHTSPVKDKKTMKNRLNKVGITNAYMAENIAYMSALDSDPDRPLYNPEQNGGYFSYTFKGDPLLQHTYLSLAKALVDQWMNSKGHRKNILNPDYTYLGCGAAHYQDASFFNMDRFKATQNFSSIDAQIKTH